MDRPLSRSPLRPPEIEIEYPLLRNFKTPKFEKFSGEDNSITTEEHIKRFKSQNFARRLMQVFSPGSAHRWYCRLPEDSVTDWRDLQNQFHEQFVRTDFEATLSNISKLYREGNEVANKIANFVCTLPMYDRIWWDRPPYFIDHCMVLNASNRPRYRFC